MIVVEVQKDQRALNMPGSCTQSLLPHGFLPTLQVILRLQLPPRLSEQFEVPFGLRGCREEDFAAHVVEMSTPLAMRSNSGAFA